MKTRTKFRINLLIILIIVGAVGYRCWKKSHWPITNWPQQIETIVAFGDSVTRGYGSRRGEDYPAHLSERLDRHVINAGQDGDTTADALKRLESDVLSHEPDMVLVGLGGNDLLQRQSADQVFKNLETIIDRVQEAGAVVVLLEIRGLPGLDFGGRYKELAKKKGCILVPNIFSGVITNPDLMYDQIHPNSAGYFQIAKKVYGEIKGYVD